MNQHSMMIALTLFIETNDANFGIQPAAIRTAADTGC